MAGVNLADARRVIAAAEKKAQEIGQPMNIAVADEAQHCGPRAYGRCVDRQHRHFHEEGLHLTRLRHCDQGPGHALAIGRTVLRIHVSNDCKIMIFAGGIPLKRDGKVVARSVSVALRRAGHAVAEAGARRSREVRLRNSLRAKAPTCISHCGWPEGHPPSKNQA